MLLSLCRDRPERSSSEAIVRWDTLKAANRSFYVSCQYGQTGHQYAVHCLTNFMHAPSETAWRASKYILRYLSGSKALGIVYESGEDGFITAFSDADWAQKRLSRKSVSEYCLKIADGLFSWRSQKQSIVAQSSKEPEFIALAFSMKEALWVFKFEHFLKRVINFDQVNRLNDISMGEHEISCIKAA